MRVFVTGGSGLVGHHIIRQLRARGDDVVALARSDEAARVLGAQGAAVVRGDLAHTAALERGIRDSDATVHAAAIVLAHGDWEYYRASNVVPTGIIARAAARAGKRLIHISSVAVYGRRTTYDGGAGSVTEEFGLDRPQFSGDHYSRSKREAELAVWAARDAHGLSAVALRPCVIYGEGDRAFANRLARVVKRGIVPLFGSGRNPLSVVYAGNVATAALAALDRPAVTGAFNVANDGVITQREFFERFAAGLGVRIRFIPVPTRIAWPVAKGADAMLRLVRPSLPMSALKTAVQFLSSPNPFVSAKAERELGWKAELDAREAVERTGEWFSAR